MATLSKYHSKLKRQDSSYMCKIIRTVEKIILAMWIMCYCASLHTLPQGGVVASGNASINTKTPNKLQIDQTSNSTILNWQSFNITPIESVNFIQPNVNSVAINRINGANGVSNILGQLKSNGEIFLLNPAGILFGKNAQINVGGIVASTSDINMNDYAQGQGTISLAPKSNYYKLNGGITNLGSITARAGGFVDFVAPNVVNSGVITAKLGHVQLSSGDYFTVDLYGDGLINLAIPADMLNPILRNYNITNKGQIYADGGSIVISAANAANIASSIISMEGLMRADSVGETSGNITLTNQAGSIYFTDTSRTYARGEDLNSVGGYVKATSNEITLASGSIIDVSGNGGGGQVYIGGNSHGQLLASGDFNAQTVTMDPGATILANAKTSGNGGTIVLWSEGNTSVGGNLSANSGTNSGNGGSIETSGANLNILPQAIVSATSLNSFGKTGLWLLDPEDLAVDNTLAGNISTALGSTNVTITTVNGQNNNSNSLSISSTNINPNGVGDIAFINSSPVTWNNTNTFSVIANNNIIFAPSTITPQIISTGGGTIHLQTNGDPAYISNGGQILYSTNSSSLANAIANASSTVPVSNPVVQSTNGGLIEYYINAPSGQLTGTSVLRAGNNNLSNMLSGNNIMEYQYIYNPDTQASLGVPAATVSGMSFANALSFAPSAGDVFGYALHDSITISSTGDIPNYFGNSPSKPYVGSFDGLGNTINFNLIEPASTLSGNQGLFANISSASAPVYIKNLTIENENVTSITNVKSVGLGIENQTSFSDGTLIGNAVIANGNPINISNITVNNSNVVTAGNASSNTSGGLIGSVQNSDGLGGNFNISNITTNALSVNTVNTVNTTNTTTGGLIGGVSISNPSNGISSTQTISPVNININNITATGTNTVFTNPTTNTIFTPTIAGGLIGSINGFQNNNINMSNLSMGNISIDSANITATSTAGGLVGSAVNTNLNLSGNINITNNSNSNNTTITTTDINNPTATGGLFGSVVSGNITFNPNNLNVTVGVPVVSSGSTNATAGNVIGSLDETAVTAPKVTAGLANTNVFNTVAIHDVANACQGPSSGLCISETATISAPSITNNTTPILSGTYSDSNGATINSVSVSIIDSNGNVVQTSNNLVNLASGSGSWSYTPASGLQQGTYTVQVTTTENNGNSYTTSSGNMLIATTPPTVAITTIPAITNNAMPVISGTYSDTSGATVNSVSISINGNTAPVSFSNGNWTYTPTLTPGTYPVTVSATDNAGNISVSAPINITIDTTPPTVAITTIPTITNRTTPVISGTYSDSNGANVNALSVVIDENRPVPITNFGNGNWTYTPTLTPGTHSVSVIAIDNAGNSNKTSSSNITIDTTPPTLAITTIPTITDKTKPVISGTYNDSGATVNAVDITIDGGKPVPVSSFSNGNWTYKPTLTPGTHSVAVIATDKAGNSNTSTPSSIIIDPVAPKVAITTQIPTNTNTTPTEISGTVKASDGGTVDSVILTIKNNKGDIIQTSSNLDPNGTGNWSYTPQSLAPGTYTINVAAADDAGNIKNISSGSMVINTINTTPASTATITTSAPSSALPTNSAAAATLEQSVPVAQQQTIVTQIDKPSTAAAVQSGPSNSDTSSSSGGSSSSGSGSSSGSTSQSNSVSVGRGGGHGGTITGTATEVIDSLVQSGSSVVATPKTP